METVYKATRSITRQQHPPSVSNTFPRIIAHLHKPKHLFLFGVTVFLCLHSILRSYDHSMTFTLPLQLILIYAARFLQPNNFDKWGQLTGSLDLMAIGTTIFAGHQIRCDFIIFLSANHVLSQQSRHKYRGTPHPTPAVYKDSNLRNYADPTHNKRKKFNDHISQHREVAVQQRLCRYGQTEFNPRSMVPEIC